MDKLTQLEDKLTGALTTCIREDPVRVTRAPGPRVPSWWRGDEDASQGAVLAMSQISR